MRSYVDGVIQHSFQQLSHEHTNVYFFDQALDLLCGSKSLTRSSMLPGTGTTGFVDDNHWTMDTGLFIAPHLACFLEFIDGNSNDEQG